MWLLYIIEHSPAHAYARGAHFRPSIGQINDIGVFVIDFDPFRHFDDGQIVDHGFCLEFRMRNDLLHR